MLQEEKTSKINNSFGSGSLGDKNGSVNMTMKEVSKQLILLFKFLNVIIFFIVIIVFVSGYFLLISPAIKDLSSSQDILNKKTKELNDLESYKTDSANLNDAFQKIKQAKSQDLLKLKNILPQEKELPELVAQVEALVLSQDLILANITLNNVSSPGSKSQRVSVATSTEGSNLDNSIIKEVEVTLSIIGGNGTYEKVKNLLTVMENHMRLIDITSFSFDEKMTSYSIIFKTYYLNQ